MYTFPELCFIEKATNYLNSIDIMNEHLMKGNNADIIYFEFCQPFIIYLPHTHTHTQVYIYRESERER